MIHTKDTIAVRLKMIELGIIPAITGYELSQMLKSLDKKDRRVAQRKFRKQWKKLLKKKPFLMDMLTSTKPVPHKNVKRNRSVLVVLNVLDDINGDQSQDVEKLWLKNLS